MIRERHNARRRAFTLVLTVLVLGMLMAVTGQLTTQISVDAIITLRDTRALQHELAVDSMLLALTDAMYDDTHGRHIPSELDRLGRADVNLELDLATVSCVVTDDAAKFNPQIFQASRFESLLTRKLEGLRDSFAIPNSRVELNPIVNNEAARDCGLFRWFDQVLSEVTPGTIFGLDDSGINSDTYSWSDAVTFWGDGRVGLRRVSEPVLAAAVNDLQPGLARRMITRRPADRSLDFTTTVMTAVPAELHSEVARRVTFDPKRYALRIMTDVTGDRRRWYMVARIDREMISILHRSRVTW